MRICITTTRSVLTGMSFENMVMRKYGETGSFAIETARLVDELKNPRFMLIAHNWSVARSAAPKNVRVKQTVTVSRSAGSLHRQATP